MKATKWNDSWKFWKDKDSFALVWNVPENARDITLPHDAMIEEGADPASPNGGNTGYRNAEIYTYVKTLYAPEEYRDKTVLLQFDGIYMNAFVYVNQQLAAKNPYGYTGFVVPLNDLLHYGEENEIRVQVRAGAMTNSRWYSGAGIYRDAWLLEGSLTHIAPEGVRVLTESVDGGIAVLNIQTELVNRSPLTERLLVVTTIKDPAGTIVGSATTATALRGQEERTLRTRIALDDPQLWSADSPALYTCETQLICRDAAVKTTAAGPAKNTAAATVRKELGARVDRPDTGSAACRANSASHANPAVWDESKVSFGIRTLCADAKRGLRINGKTVNLRGACIHHDSGLLGAATYADAQYRQVRLLKEAGFNAIRMSHHPMAPAMLSACDEIGMYVMDEGFDMWNRLKSDYDYGLFFREWWEKDVTAMVRKDFNHPCVILYSAGNEIPEIGTEQGAATCHAICEKIRSLDPTRFLTSGINGVFCAGDAIDQIVADISAGNGGQAEGGNVNQFLTAMDEHMDQIVTHKAVSDRLEMACAPLDIAGYNYMTDRYEKDRETYPNRVIVGSETYPPEIARNWDLVERYPHLVGDFTWTGWDYIGEAGVGIPAYKPGEGGFGAVYPAQLAYCGDIDLTGFRRPASYFREAVFGLRKDPYICVQNVNHSGDFLIKTPWVISDASANWNWPGMEGKPAVVEVYSPGDEVELFLNGTSLGKKPAGAAAGFRTLFETVYEPGTLTAVSYEQGKEIGRAELATAGAERKLVLTEETPACPAAAAVCKTPGTAAAGTAVPAGNCPAQELVYVQVEMRDTAGHLAAEDNQKITLQTEGDAQILGFGSGNPKPNYNYNSAVSELFGGRALIILKKPAAPLTLKVTAEDGTVGVLTIQ